MYNLWSFIDVFNFYCLYEFSIIRFLLLYYKIKVIATKDYLKFCIHIKYFIKNLIDEFLQLKENVINSKYKQKCFFLLS